MSEIIILNCSDKYQEQVRDIFFESSTKKNFESQTEKDNFFWKYAGFYLSHYPEYAFVAVSAQKVLGYVLGMPKTQDPDLYRIQPHLLTFEEYFKTYPAHLHINCHESSRGQGVGKLLLERFVQELERQGVSGLHIMTGPESDNKRFYQKLGFDFEAIEGVILLMGKKLKVTV